MQDLEQLILQSDAEKVAVAYRDVAVGAAGDELFIQADEPFHPASTIKLCVMMEVFRQAHGGAFNLEDCVPIRNEFRSIVEGSPFHLSAQDDSETSLYSRIGDMETLRELVRLMIVRSSNLATNILVEQVTPAAVTEFMHELGATDLLVRRGVEDNKAYALGLNNVATARDLMRLLLCVAQGRVVSPWACDEMVSTLLGQQFNEGIPAPLPTGVRVAHKTGWNDRLYHDAAIVYPTDRPPYVLVVMTRGIPEDVRAYALVSSISRMIYDAL
jgi:beta-lactamase class A